MIDVCLLGCGGMMPLPYRYLTSLMVRYNGRTILLDCGEGTQVALRRRGWSPNPIDMILFTHYHADHISGLPGMLLTMGNAQRTEPVTLVGPKGLERVVGALRVIAPGLPFEIRYHELPAKGEDFVLPTAPELKISAFKVMHSVPCFGYSFTLPRVGRFDAQRAKELEIPLPYWSRLQKGETITDESGRVYTPDMVLGPARKGLKLTYATDSRPCRSIVDAAEGADLFICEGMYGDDAEMDKAKEKRHMCFSEAAKMARAAQPGRLWLTHYSPSLLKPDEYLEQTRKIFPATFAGKDGKTIVLNFEDEGGTKDE